MFAIALVAITLLTPALFQTPELTAFHAFTEETSEKKDPVSGEERMELYDQLAFFYLSAAGSAERVWQAEETRIKEEGATKVASLQSAHQKRLVKGKQRIKKQKLSPKKKQARIKKMRRASLQKYLSDKKKSEAETTQKLSDLQSDYWEATSELSNLQLLALQYIDTIPEKP